MHLPILFLLLHFATANLLLPRRQPTDSMSTPSLPTSLLPSIASTSVPFSIPSPSSSFSPQSTPASSSTTPPSPSTTSISTTTSTSAASASTLSLASSTPFSSTASTSAETSTSAAPSAPVAVGQSSSSYPAITFINGAGAPSQGSPSSVVVLTSTTATPSSTTTQSSSSGFFSNTGAVAGTFTVVGLLSIAGVIALVLFIAKHRRSRSYEEDTEYLDKSPELSTDPPITQVTSPDDGSSSDHAHYGAPPMTLATPPTAYYLDHPYAPHPQAFSPEAYPSLPSHGYPSLYPVASTRDYAAQRIYSPEDYDIAYPPPAPRPNANLPNSHPFTDVELSSAPVPPTQTPLPNALRPSINSNPSAPKQWASTRFSIDSFYAGIATDTPPPPGRAL